MGLFELWKVYRIQENPVCSLEFVLVEIEF